MIRAGLVAVGKLVWQEDTVNEAVRSVVVPRQRRGMPLLGALLISPLEERRRSWSKHLRGVGIGRVLESASLEDALTRGRSAARRGVCLIEAAPQDASIFRTVRQLRQQGWERLVLVTSTRDIDTVRTALAARIRSLIVDTTAPDYVPRRARPHRTRSPNWELSEREVQVVQLVANGNTNRGVGEKLNLSTLTVKSHLSRIGRKLGTGDRAEIVATCMRARLIV